jgi:hypothetical protein
LGIDLASFGIQIIWLGQPGLPGSQRSCPRQVSLRESILETGSRSEATTAGDATSERNRYENR